MESGRVKALEGFEDFLHWRHLFMSPPYSTKNAKREAAAQNVWRGRRANADAEEKEKGSGMFCYTHLKSAKQQ